VRFSHDSGEPRWPGVGVRVDVCVDPRIQVSQDPVSDRAQLGVLSIRRLEPVTCSELVNSRKSIVATNLIPSQPLQSGQ
jgi:hypothetical protein